MITLICWSRNRSAQLHLLLESIHKNIPGVFENHIIYKADSAEYQDGYDICLNHFTNDHFYGESEHWNLERLTRQIIQDSTNKQIAFFTDDTVIYMLAPLVGSDFLKRVRTDGAVFSLRLGYNTIMQNCHTGELQAPLHIYIDEDKTVSWNFNHHHPLSNYGYPFGLDGHIYSIEVIKNLISGFTFKNTNELESNLFHFKYSIPPVIRSFKHSVAVNIPCNNGSGVTRAGEVNPYTIEELNEAYLSGKRICLSDIMNQAKNIIGAHQELKLTFTCPNQPESPTNLQVSIKEKL